MITEGSLCRNPLIFLRSLEEIYSAFERPWLGRYNSQSGQGHLHFPGSHKPAEDQQ